MNLNEIIKDREVKDADQLATQLAPVRVDLKKLLELSASRFVKLEKIKTDIPLKTYHLLLDKLTLEKKRIEEDKKKDVQITEQQNAPQVLPKSFFEKKEMKPKMIRID